MRDSTGGDAAFSWWWADPLAGLLYFAVREGREAWEGKVFADD